MPKITLTRRERKAGLDLRDVLGHRQRAAKSAAERKHGVTIQEQCTHKRYLDSVDLKHRPIRTCSDCGVRLPIEATRESEKLHARATLLRAAADSLSHVVRARTYDEHGALADQARACRREAGILLRRARQLAERSR